MLCGEELVPSIKDKMPDFPIHVSDLKAPTAKFVQSYYVRILEELGVEAEELREPSAEILHELEYLDAYRCVIPLANIHGALCCLFKDIYVDDFSVLDFIEPSPRRTQFLIKAMDGFHTFADWKAQAVQDVIEKLHKRKTAYDRLRAEIEEVKEKLNMCASEQAWTVMAKKELNALYEETKLRFLKLKEEDSELEKKIASREAVAEQQVQEQRQLQTEIEKLEEQVSELQSKIVVLPAHLEAELNHLREEKQKIVVEKQELLELKQEKNRQKELYEKFLQKQEKCAAKLKEISALSEQIKMCKKKQESQETLQALVTEKQEIKGKTKKLHMKVIQLQEEKMALGMQREKGKPALIQSSKEAESVPNHLKKAEDSLTNVKAKIKQVEEEKKLLTELSVKQNKIYDKLYEEKIAKQDATIKEIQDTQTRVLEKIKKMRS